MQRGFRHRTQNQRGKEEGRSALAVKQITEEFVERSLSIFEFLQSGIECL